MTQAAAAQTPAMNGKFKEPPKALGHTFGLSSYTAQYAFVEHKGTSVLVALFRHSSPTAAQNGVPFSPPSIEYMRRCMWNDAGVEQLKPRGARLPADDEELVLLLESLR